MKMDITNVPVSPDDAIGQANTARFAALKRAEAAEKALATEKSRRERAESEIQTIQVIYERIIAAMFREGSR